MDNTGKTLEQQLADATAALNTANAEVETAKAAQLKAENESAGLLEMNTDLQKQLEKLQSKSAGLVLPEVEHDGETYEVVTKEFTMAKEKYKAEDLHKHPDVVAELVKRNAKVLRLVEKK